MRSVIYTKTFKRDFAKLQSSSKYRSKHFLHVLELLQQDTPLPPKYRDHSLKGLLKDFRECHVQNDVLLMYKKEKDVLVLTLVRIGTHAHLFGK